jgi:hypothetical protein
MSRKRVLAICGALCLAAGRLPAQTTQAEVLAEIKALRERLAKLESQVNGAVPTPAAPAPPAPAEAPKAEEAPPAPVFSAGPIEFSGLVDAYYSLNFNHPASGNNVIRNFDTNANQFSLNMAKITLAHTPDPIGFRVDLGLGPAFDIVNGLDPAGLGGLRHVQQAYFSANVGKGTVDIGKFVTAHGAEVIETHSNWNYSRSLLFAWAIPYYHFGVRYTYPLHKTFTGMVHLVNGWNNVRDNNSGKSFGFSGIWSPSSRFTWAHNYMVGPENTGTNTGLRHMYDTTATVTVNDKLALMANFDHGVNSFGAGAGKASWRGIAGYARISPTSWFAFVPRVEWFDDHDGFSTGVAQKLKEATITAEFKMKEGFLSRLEYRRDWSDQPFFDRGSTPASHKSQDTLLAGFTVLFGPKR